MFAVVVLPLKRFSSIYSILRQGDYGYSSANRLSKRDQGAYTFKADKISILREDLIFYRCNRKNAVTNSRNKTFFDYFKIFNLIGDNLKKINLFDEMKYYYWDYKVITLYWWFMKVRLPYKREFFNRMKYDFKHLGMQEEDKEFVRNRTLFLIDRFTKMPFFVYYPLFFFFDKIFRIERGKKNYALVFFSSYEKWYEYKKKA